MQGQDSDRDRQWPVKNNKIEDHNWCQKPALCFACVALSVMGTYVSHQNGDSWKHGDSRAEKCLLGHSLKRTEISGATKRLLNNLLQSLTVP